MPKIDAAIGLRYLLGLWVLGTLTTLFWCIVLTPVILMIGFAGKFWPVWNAIAASSGVGLSRSSDPSCYSNAMDLAAYNGKP